MALNSNQKKESEDTTVEKKVVLGKKLQIVIVVLTITCVLGSIIFLLAGCSSNEENGTNIVGTWYSNRPDQVTFDSNGGFSFSEWNGGDPWLSFPGSYTVAGDSITLENSLDGTFTLVISQAEDGTVTLVGPQCIYYQTEEAAMDAIEAAEMEEQERQENIVPDTVAILLGEWVTGYLSNDDEDVICTFTESDIKVYIQQTGETEHFNYEILSDSSIQLNQEDKPWRNGIYSYTLSKGIDGVYTLSIHNFPSLGFMGMHYFTKIS